MGSLPLDLGSKDWPRAADVFVSICYPSKTSKTYVDLIPCPLRKI